MAYLSLSRFSKIRSQPNWCRIMMLCRLWGWTEPINLSLLHAQQNLFCSQQRNNHAQNQLHCLILTTYQPISSRGWSFKRRANPIKFSHKRCHKPAPYSGSPVNPLPPNPSTSLFPCASSACEPAYTYPTLKAISNSPLSQPNSVLFAYWAQSNAMTKKGGAMKRGYGRVRELQWIEA